MKIVIKTHKPKKHIKEKNITSKNKKQRKSSWENTQQELQINTPKISAKKIIQNNSQYTIKENTKLNTNPKQNPNELSKKNK